MSTFAFSRSRFSVGAAIALLVGCGTSHLPFVTSPSGAAQFPFTHHTTFSYTGKKQTFSVPSGVTRIHVIAVGGSGGGRVVANGGRVSAVIPVRPSETLAIYVGGAGTSSGGGFNGGGAGGQITGYTYGDGYGGGGASDVREGGDALRNRIVAVGGGAGQGFTTRDAPGGHGGRGGAKNGGFGKAGCCKRGRNEGDGGTGGTPDQGGSGGESPGDPGKSGQLGNGGAGGSGCDSCYGYFGGSGGGGGGGFYGGGGGGGGVYYGSQGAGSGGGGGGSSYVEPGAIKFHMWRGWKTAAGNGVVVISW